MVFRSVERSELKRIKGIANNHSFAANLRIVLTFTGLCFGLRKESYSNNRPFSVVYDWIGASKLSLPFPSGCAAVWHIMFQNENAFPLLSLTSIGSPWPHRHVHTSWPYKGRTIRKLMGKGGGGGGQSTKKIFARGKIKWKKIHVRQLTLK